MLPQAAGWSCMQVHSQLLVYESEDADSRGGWMVLPSDGMRREKFQWAHCWQRDEVWIRVFSLSTGAQL